MHADPLLPCGFRGREEIRRGEKGMVKEGIYECGLCKLKASHRVDRVCFSDSSQTQLTDAGKVTQKNM